MNVFLIVSIALTVVVVLWLLWPLRRGARRGTLTVTELNSKVYRDQLQELERDLARGQLNDANYQEARDELQRRLLQDVTDVPAPVVAKAPAATGVRGRWTAISLAVLVPIVAAAMYRGVGNVGAIDAVAAAALLSPEQKKQQEMLSRLVAVLEKSPDNYKGWVLLARAYRSMERYPESARAYDRAAPLVTTNPDLLIEQAEVLTVSANDDLEGRPMELVRKALTLEPSHPMALMLTGMSAYRRGEFAEAIAQWQKLLTVLPPGSDDARDVQSNIDQARAKGGPALAAALASAPAVPAKSADKAPAVASAGASISGEVSLSPAVQAGLSPDDTVFIVARPDDGSRAPLAVLRKKVSDLPLKFTLDDSLAMMPDRTISKARGVVVVARVSRSGQPIPQPGDLTSEPTAALAPGATGLKLVIDKKL